MASDIESAGVGRVVTRGDPDALAGGIRDALEIEDEALPERCRSLCERRYSARENAERVLNVYAEVVGTEY